MLENAIAQQPNLDCPAATAYSLAGKLISLAANAYTFAVNV